MDTTTPARATSYEVLERFLAGYWTTRTRDNYRFILTRWLEPPDAMTARDMR